MASKSEVGHARNVARFQQLIARCRAYGADYNPAIPALAIPALEDLLQRSRASLTDLTTSVTAFNNATNARREAFEDIKGLSTRLFNWVAAAGLDDYTVGNAQAINRKIQGTRAPKSKRTTMEPPTVPPTMASLALYNEALRRRGLPPVTADEENKISVSQQSYDQLTYNFERLVIFLDALPAYAPNEAALQVANLQTKHSELLAMTEALDNAYAETTMIRERRNQTLYADNDSLYGIAMRVKKYVKSVYGAKRDSPYRYISGIRFSKPRLRKRRKKDDDDGSVVQRSSKVKKRKDDLDSKLEALRLEVLRLEAQKEAALREKAQREEAKRLEAEKLAEIEREELKLKALRREVAKGGEPCGDGEKEARMGAGMGKNADEKGEDVENGVEVEENGDE